MALRESVHQFQALVAREELIGRGLQELANGICGGSVASLFSELLGSRRLTQKKRETLRKLVDDLDHKGD